MITVYVHFKKATAKESCCTFACQGSVLLALYVLIAKYVHVEISFPMDFVFQTLPDMQDQCVYHAYDTSPGARVSITAMRVSGYYKGQWNDDICGTLAIVRTFSPRDYLTKGIQVTEVEARAMLHFACAQLGKPLLRRRTDIFIRPTPSDGETWYCVEIVVALLQQAGKLTRYLPRSLTADALAAVIDRECVVQPVSAQIYSIQPSVF